MTVAYFLITSGGQYYAVNNSGSVVRATVTSHNLFWWHSLCQSLAILEKFTALSTVGMTIKVVEDIWCQSCQRIARRRASIYPYFTLYIYGIKHGSLLPLWIHCLFAGFSPVLLFLRICLSQFLSIHQILCNMILIKPFFCSPSLALSKIWQKHLDLSCFACAKGTSWEGYVLDICHGAMAAL